jgi:hypothetical protein
MIVNKGDLDAGALVTSVTDVQKSSGTKGIARKQKEQVRK